MKVSYLEIVTPEVDATIQSLIAANRVIFTDPIEALGNARIAILDDGGRVGVRAPMHEMETPVCRPYFATDDIQAATDAALKAGAELAHPPLEIPGQGTFSIVIHGGNHLAFWQD